MKGRAGNRFRVPLLCAALVIVLGAIGVGINLWWTRATVALYIPPRPSLKGWPAELADGLEEGESAAHTYFDATNGLNTLSRLYHANGFYNEALECYEGLRRVQSKEPRWPDLEADILADFGRSNEAEPLYRTAIALAPNYIPARIKLGNVLVKAADNPGAQSVFEGALQRQPDNPYALLGLARILVNRNAWPEARMLLGKALQSHPDFVGGLSLLVTIEEHLGDQARANQLKSTIGAREFSDVSDPWFDELTPYCYDAYRLSVAASTARVGGDSGKARQLLEQAIRIAPQNGSYQRQLGTLLADSNAYNDARPIAEKATELSPSDPYAWTLLVRVLDGLKDNNAGWRALAEALMHCPQSADLHLLRGRRLYASGRAQEAVQEFKETHRLWPSEAAPLVELAQADFALNESNEALAALHEALQRQPDNPTALATLTFYYIGTGNRLEADRWWEETRRQNRMPAQTVLNLHEAYQAHFNHPIPE